jgi:hypothetical protein
LPLCVKSIRAFDKNATDTVTRNPTRARLRSSRARFWPGTRPRGRLMKLMLFFTAAPTHLRDRRGMIHRSNRVALERHHFEILRLHSLLERLRQFFEPA